MSIPDTARTLAQAAPQYWEYSSAAAAIGFAMLVAWLAGVFRRSSVRGPSRLEQNERLGAVWLIVGMGVFAWLFVPGFYAAAVMGSNAGNRVGAPASTTAATAPATQPLFTPAETVGVSLVTGIVVLVALIGGNMLLRPGYGLARIGFTQRNLVRTVLQGIVAVLIVLPFMFAVAVFLQGIYQRVGFEHPNAHELLRLLGRDSSMGMRIGVTISAVFLAPVFEEMLFRGHIQTAILYTIARAGGAGPSRGFDVILPSGAQPDGAITPQTVVEPASSPTARMRWLAILITSVLFALVHGELWLMPPIFVLSICLGYAYERTGNLWVSIAIHASFNAANVAAFLLSK